MAVIESLAAVRERIAAAAQKVGRDPSEISVLPVSKFHSVDAMRELMEAGITLFGENRLQELADKRKQLPEARFAMIGHVQRNKVRLVVDHVAELHSLSSVRLAAALHHRLLDEGRRLPVLIQINTSDEPQKSGIAPQDAVGFARSIQDYSGLYVQGLMTMAVQSPDPDEVASCFVRLREVQADLRDQVPDLHWDELSMGMSGDFELAIEHGATMVRIGTALFGPRPTTDG
ncbi:MAG: YggS family pyridoxal phosphate-dependent enzyme [Propionibacterium sp.]|nr:YggS family pyridoxal phosphate-dependent enzyme [Propionibacterium sp.]